MFCGIFRHAAAQAIAKALHRTSSFAARAIARSITSREKNTAASKKQTASARYSQQGCRRACMGASTMLQTSGRGD
jgi:hypothetical protein